MQRHGSVDFAEALRALQHLGFVLSPEARRSILAGILGVHGESRWIGIAEFARLAQACAKAADDILLTEAWWERLMRDCCGWPVRI